MNAYSNLAKLLGSILPIGFLFTANATSIWINEIHYDNVGGDIGEFVEIAGNSGVDLIGYSLTLYNGANGSVYQTVNLSGALPDQTNGFGALAFPILGIQNGSPDGLALANGSNLIEFLSYEGVFSAIGGPANGLSSVNIGVSEPSSTPVGYSLQLTGTGVGSSPFAWQAPLPQTPGSLNGGQSFRVASVPSSSNTGLLLGLVLCGLASAPVKRRLP